MSKRLKVTREFSVKPPNDTPEKIPYWVSKELLEESTALLGDVYPRNWTETRCIMFPYDFGKSVERAIEDTVEKCKRELVDQEEAMAHSDSDESGGIPIPSSETPEDKLAPYKCLVEALAYCPAVTVAFACLPWLEDDDKICRCPFSKIMKKWRDDWGINPGHDECRSSNAINPQFKARGFVNHLEDRAKHDVEHWIVLEYLKNLFKDVYGVEGFWHEAFYDVGTADYRRVTAAKQRSQLLVIAELERQVVEKDKALAKYEKDMASMKVVNVRLYDKFKTVDKLQKRLGIEAKEKDEHDLVMALKLYKSTSVNWRLQNMKGGVEFDGQYVEKHSLTIHVEEDFDINELFEKWKDDIDKPRDGDHGYYFFADELEGERTFFNTWQVKFIEKVSQFSVAKDEGGPTRQFMSDFFSQLPKLSVEREGGGKVMLFAEGKNFFVPRTDSPFLRANDAHRYYRAVGRVIAYCVIHNFHMPEKVLMPIHKAYLFQGWDPEEERYSAAELFGDFCSNLDEADSWAKEWWENLSADGPSDPNMQYIEELGHNEKSFRSKMKERYVREYQEFLRAMQEGVTLEGLTLSDNKVQLDCFGRTRASVDYCLFGKEEITLESLSKVLYPKYEHLGEEVVLDTQKKVLEHENGQEKAKGVFVSALENLEQKYSRESNSRESFVALFVYFLSGYSYIPRSSFKLVVEFTLEEDHQIIAHTCENTIRIPKLAYDGDEETLARELDKSVSSVKWTKFGMG